MSLDSGIEKESAAWEFVTDGEQDAKDFVTLQRLMNESQDVPENKRVPDFERKALLLRRGKHPLGYAVFDVDDWGAKKVLEIEMIYVLDKERNPLFMVQLFEKLRTYAQEQNVTHVHWAAGSEEVERASKNVPTIGEGLYLVPIEQFNLDTFVGRI